MYIVHIYFLVQKFVFFSALTINMPGKAPSGAGQAAAAATLATGLAPGPAFLVTDPTVIAPDPAGLVPGPPAHVPAAPGPDIVEPRPALRSVQPPSLPAACVDFVSNVWNNFETTVMPFLGGLAKQAVRTNKDPSEIGAYDSVKIQDEILNGTYSKYHFFHIPCSVVGDQSHIRTSYYS